MIKFEFQNPDHNDTWRFIIAFCMTQPEGTPNVDLQRMLAEQFGIEAVSYTHLTLPTILRV